MKYSRSDYGGNAGSLKGYWELYRSCTGRPAPEFDDRFSQAVMTWLDGKDVPDFVHTGILSMMVSLADWLDSCNTRHSAVFEEGKRPDNKAWFEFVMEFLDVMRQEAAGQLEEGGDNVQSND